MTASEPIHPGEHLAEIMSELGITQYRLAKTIGVPQVRIHDIVHCRRSITADTALRIGKALGMTPDFWLTLQRMYDLDVARGSTDVSAIEPLVEVASESLTLKTRSLPPPATERTPTCPLVGALFNNCARAGRMCRARQRDGR